MKHTLIILSLLTVTLTSKAQQESQMRAIDSFFTAQNDSVVLSEKMEASDKEFKRTKNVQKKKDRDYYNTKRNMKHGDLQRMRKQYKIKQQ